jgi:acylphosphatase
MVTRVVVGGFLTDPEPTIAIGFGTTDDGTVAVAWSGEWRAMMELGEAMRAGTEPIFAEVEDWQVLAIHEIAEGQEE